MAFRFNTISEDDIRSSRGGNQMMDAIDYEGPRNMLITGRPGSGKTTVTLMRATRLAKAGKSVLILTYQKLLVISLRNIAPEELQFRIFTMHQWLKDHYNVWLDEKISGDYLRERLLTSSTRYDEILLDEGQDLFPSVYQAIPSIAGSVMVGADEGQKVHEHGTRPADIAPLLMRGTKERMAYELQYNYRNYFEIYDFARQFMSHAPNANQVVMLENMPRGKGGAERLPILIQTADEEDTLARLENLLLDNQNVNVALLFYHTNEVDRWLRHLSRRPALKDLKMCKFHSDMSEYERNQVASSMENIVLTTYKSAKGLEFQVVIMPQMQFAGAAPYMKPEHYYVGCTRATERLYLLYNSDKLPNCLISFTPTSYQHLALSKSSPAALTEDLPF